MKSLLKILTLLFVCGSIFTSCKKSDATPQQPTDTGLNAEGITFLANDTAQSFNTCTWQSQVNSDGSSGNAIMANNESAAGFLEGASNFNITIITPAPLKVGSTYTSQALGANRLAFAYVNSLSFGFGIQDGALTGTLTVTELTSTYIKGTFSVNISGYSNLTPNPPSEKITKGEFYGKLVNPG